MQYSLLHADIVCVLDIEARSIGDPEHFQHGTRKPSDLAALAILCVAHLLRFFTSSSIRFFQSALSGLQARTVHTASPITS